MGRSRRCCSKLEGTPYAGRVSIVDHREIFAGFEQHLPTFNSRSIISVLWRIPGLAENFVYFNDDMLLLMPVRAEDFFREGKIVLRGKWMTQSAYRPSRRIATWLKRILGRKQDKVSNLDSQEHSARIAGFERRFYRLYHNPYPMRVSVLRDFFAAHPDLLAGNVELQVALQRPVQGRSRGHASRDRTGWRDPGQQPARRADQAEAATAFADNTETVPCGS